MKKAIITVVLLIFSNTFMTLAWYVHLKLKEMNKLVGVSIFLVILMSWGLLFSNIFSRSLPIGLVLQKTGDHFLYGN